MNIGVETMRKCLPIMAEDFREVYEIVESYNDNTKVDMYEHFPG